MDTHAAYKQLVHSGLEDRIAETVIKIIDENTNLDFKKLATKDELKLEASAIRLDIANVRTELKEDIANVRTELKENIANVRTELKEDIGKLAGDLSLLKWMVGICISLSIAIIAKMFLGG
jgi:hypothetical protein